jgi:hypothetical protein
MVRQDRRGFSLLEIIIATAALAGSAMVLVSLLGLGTQFGSKAEMRTLAIGNAQSIMDEFLASGVVEGGDSQERISGVIEGRWPMSYRISLLQHSFGQSSGSTAENGPEMMQVCVEIFESEAQLRQEAMPPICRISQLIRSPQRALAQFSQDDVSSNSQQIINNQSSTMEGMPSLPGTLSPGSL